MNWLKRLHNDQYGDAVVEATFLFPIIFMIFFCLVMLAMYLPTRSALQYATQYTANAIAVERSDTWLSYNADQMKYVWISDENELSNVYVALFDTIIGKKKDYKDIATKMVESIENKTETFPSGDLEVCYYARNCVVYKEIVVTATRNVPVPVDFSLIGFPKKIPITVSSTAIVKNGDEFIRSVDLATDIVDVLRDKYEGIDNIFNKLKEVKEKFYGFLEI